MGMETGYKFPFISSSSNGKAVPVPEGVPQKTFLGKAFKKQIKQMQGHGKQCQ